MEKAGKLIISLALPQLAGLLGTLYSVDAVPGWYSTIEKPAFTPPDWIFAPVWLSLYALMGISLYLVWRNGLDGKDARFAFKLFIIHLFFNALWSVLFFGLHYIGIAVLEIIALWMLILVIFINFLKIHRLAGWLLLPYLIWVSYAAVLNFSIWVLN
jgi:benzodiazapine receptor